MATNPQEFDFDIGSVVGPPGATGNGISGIELLSTSGLQKTYRINMTNETHFDFVVTDGNGISGASFDSETNELTITFDNGTSFTTPSLQGAQGDPGDDGYSPAVTIETITGGHRVTITDKTHPTGQSFDVMDGEDGASDAGEVTYDKTAAYNDGTVGKAVSDLEDTVSTTQIINTASGAIASFSDGADGQPIRKLVANIEPVQDLHGQANPYPAGGGRNKLDPSRAVKDAGYNSAVGTTFTLTTADKQWVDKENGVFEIDSLGSWEQAGFYSDVLPSGSAIISISNVTGHLKGTIYVCDENFTVNRVSSIANPISEGGTFFANTTFSGTDARFVMYLAGNGEKAHIEKPYIYSGSDTSDTSYSPYSNICPISGWTGAEIEQTGRNLFDKSTGIQLEPNNLRIARTQGQGVPFKLRGGVTYTFSCNSNTPAYFYIMIPYSTTAIAQSGAKVTSFTYTPTDDIEVGLNVWWDTGRPSDATDFMIEVGSVAHDYATYTGNQISVNWEDEAETVYGGTLDLVSGVLTVDRAMVTFDGATNAIADMYNAGKFYSPIVSGIKVGTANDQYKVTLMGDTLAGIKYINFNQTDYGIAQNVGSRIVFAIASASSVAEANAWLEDNPCAIVYPLATPITYQLDPQEIRTLLGANNVWADTGDIAECEYPADTRLYIDRKIAEALGG